MKVKIKDNPELELLIKLKYGTPKDPEYFDRLPDCVVENAYALCKEFATHEILGITPKISRIKIDRTISEMREYLEVLYAVGGFQKIEKSVGQSLILYHSLLGRV